MKRRPRHSLLVCAALFWSALGSARSQAQSPRGIAPKPQPKQKTLSKTRPQSSLLPLWGVAAGALMAGVALGWAFKTARSSASQSAPAADFYDQVPVPLALVVEGEKIARRNPAFERLFGSRSRILPEIFHPDDWRQAHIQLHETLDGARPNISLLCRVFGSDGAPLHGVLSGQKANDSQHKNALLLAFRDTTAQFQAETELDGAREAISALYQVIAGDKTRDLNSKIRALLAMGCGRFELPFGVVGRITSEGLETLWVQSPQRRIRPAMTLSRASGGGEAELLGLACLPDHANWREFPFVAQNQGTCYLGAPILVENELFGMLSFSRVGARDQPFNPGEIELLQLMADWVGGEIERENTKISLEKQRRALLEVNEKLEALATQDALTGAKNRRAFTEKLEEEWARARRYGLPLSLVMLDVDKFKLFNDSFGHPAGDEVLRRVSSVVMAAIRGTDFFARYGGEEFVLLLPNTDAEGAMILANRLREKIASAPWKERAITASLGVSSADNTEHKNAADLLQAADDALYYSKENGRNRVTHTLQMKGGAEETPAPEAMEGFEAFG